MAYGCNVKSSVTVNYFQEIDTKTRYDHVNINNIKRNFIAITAHKVDCIYNSHNVTSVPVTYRRNSIYKNHKRYHKVKVEHENGSWIALLFLCVMDVQIDPIKITWNDESAKKLKYSKK